MKLSSRDDGLTHGKTPWLVENPEFDIASTACFRSKFKLYQWCQRRSHLPLRY